MNALLRFAPALTSLILTLFAAGAVAGEYDFEVGGSYSTNDYDDTGPSFGSTWDADETHLYGTWFYTGLSDSKGPKSRAMLLDHASGLRFDYRQINQDEASFEIGVSPFPDFSITADSQFRIYDLSARHVWKDSGWIGTADIVNIDLDATVNFNGMVSEFGESRTAYSVGLGKYIGEATTLGLKVIYADDDDSSTTAYELALAHVGKLGSTWHYAADITYSNSNQEGADGDYALGIAFFPTTNFEFGLQIREASDLLNPGGDIFGGNVGWFVRENLELMFVYEASDSDYSEATFGVRVRF